MLRDNGDGVITYEGRPTGNHLVQHAAEGVEVAQTTGFAPYGLFGRHVARGADHHPGHREAASVEGDRQAEIADLDGPLFRQPDVAGLQVAVNNSVRVSMREPLADLAGNAQHLCSRKPPTLGSIEYSRQVSPGHVLRDDIRLAGLLADIEDGDNLWMVAQPPHCLRLAAHPREAVRVQAFGLDQRKRDVAVELRIMRQINPLAATLAEEPADGIAIRGERRRKTWRGRRSGRTLRRRQRRTAAIAKGRGRRQF